VNHVGKVYRSVRLSARRGRESTANLRRGRGASLSLRHEGRANYTPTRMWRFMYTTVTVKVLISVFAVAGVLATIASASTINYNTTGSILSCNGVGGCTQNTTTSVTIGGLTFTYNTGSGSGVITPSIINLGNIVSTGTGTSVNVTGLLLSIDVNSTPPGSNGTLPNGAISGTISTSTSGASLFFSPNNTTTGFGTLPGVVIGNGAQSFTYQILNPTQGLQAPTVGNPIGQTSIQGTVTDTSVAATPEPMPLLMISAGLDVIGLIRRRTTC
jgi:hypothetical protein